MTNFKVAVLAGLISLATLAPAVQRVMRVKVLDSETRSLDVEASSVPTNCEQLTFDAYCRSSRNSVVTSTLLVQEGNDPPFRISCTINSKYSRCVPLPKGQSFEARREKHGVLLFYTDDKGKIRSQLYSLVEGSPSLAGPVENVEQATVDVQNVKCSFTSTPSGADVAIDGKFVGSTPSVVTLHPGDYRVVVSTSGFAQWKRELTVSPGSDLTVNAVLEKGQ